MHTTVHLRFIIPWGPLWDKFTIGVEIAYTGGGNLLDAGAADMV